MDKIKIFLSSRVKSTSNAGGLDKPFTLAEMRTHLRNELEKETLLGEGLWDVVINETDFDSPIALNAFDNCMAKTRESNVIIILYNGEAGWGSVDESNGICHEEFLIAVSEFSQMAFALDLRRYFVLPDNDPNAERNRNFALDINDAFGHIESPADNIRTVEDLFNFVLHQVKRYLLKAVELSFATQKRIVSASSVFGETLDWSKLSYPEREDELKAILTKAFSSLPDFENVIKAFHAIPDHMSVADARNRIGRPFVYEHKLLDGQPEQSGVIHFIGVYGNATEIQAKSLVGYPDITVIKTPFGSYLWEKNVHIQIFFVRNCINPQTVRTRLSETINWLNGSREKSKILKRAAARYSILKVINQSKSIAGN
jgi:hypothetical protein